MVNPPAETDAEVLQRMGTDGAKWAAEFVHLRRTRDMDEGAMIGWFANAIEAGRSQGRRETCPHLARMQFSESLALCMTCGKDVTSDAVAAG
jgi:hypothetical protein